MKLSISKLKCFESCRMAYKFKYIEELEPVQKADALVLGSNYHKLIEGLYKNGKLECEDEYSKELAMAKAYEKYIYPQFKVKAVEESFEYQINDNHILEGRVDGVAEDGCLVEHKTTSANSLEEYEYNLQWDEQILAYMLGYNIRQIWYTVIRKPTIKKKANETDEEFFERMIAWYDEDTDAKIRLMQLTRTDEEIEQFKENLIELANIMDNKPYIYRNTQYCNCWGKRCEYSSICLNYDPSERYIEFEKRRNEND